MEDPNLHLLVFLEVCDTLKINGVSTDAIRLRLFPFSLRDKARAWFHSLPLGSITTWDELTKVFLAKFFPPSKTASLRNQITSFTQREDETLYEAWEWFKELLRLCPHPPKMDGGPDFLQWSNSTGAVHDRCGHRRDTHEQDGRGGIQLD